MSKVFNSAKFKQYFYNTFWLFVEKIIKLFVGLFIGVYVARYLGAERFGQLNYAFSFVMLFSELATLGLTDIITRELINHPERKEFILGTAFTFRAISGGITCLVITIIIFLIPMDSLSRWLIILIAISLLFKPLDVIIYIFQAEVSSKYIVQSQLCVSIIIGLVKLIAIYFNLSVIYFAGIMSLEFLLLAIGFIIVYQRRFFDIFNWKLDKKLGVRILRDALPLMFGGFVVSIYMRIDQIMITQMIGETANGNYVAAIKLSEIWYMVPMVVCNSLFPAIIKAREQNKDMYYQRLQQLYDLLATFAILCAIFISFFSDYIIFLLYGGQYQQASMVLTIHIWVGIFVNIGVITSKWLMAENLTLISFQRHLLSVIINIIFNFLLIPSIGINGAALAILISSLFGSLFYDLINKSTRPLFYMKIKAFLSVLRYPINFILFTRKGF